tara:strand:- start:465 stop:641 length:177 start_codon:yes stop_codon:yes gene_type:complete
MKTMTYSFRILCDNEEAPNPVHLCEEIQVYLNEFYNAEVKGYSVEVDRFVPFIAQDEY